MLGVLTALLLYLPISTTASSSVVCIPGQCVSGYSNTTIGTTLTTSSSILLLPGTYTSNTNPQLLHDALTTSSASLSPSPGFNGSKSVSLPLTVALQPGVVFYGKSLYAGQASFTALASTSAQNTSTPITASAFALSSNVWVALNAGTSNRVVVWNSVPDVSQLPSSLQGSLSLLDIQSSACTPACSAAGVCTSSGTCTCQTGFTGASCETCAPGFFGPSCQPCPDNCATCDQGTSGTGRCLKPAVANAPSTCNCKSGTCGANGSCACTPGFTTGDDGTLCSKCLPGFFQDSNGNCQVCQLGCTACSDGTGQCTTCASGFTQDVTDKTKCNRIPVSTSNNQLCPDGSFPDGDSCSVCSSACQTCSGGTSNDCILCASGTYMNNGVCVGVNTLGVCQGTNLIADNTKRECDACGATCTKCEIPGFNGASVVSLKKCTACLPGFFLNNGTCVESCPAGTTISSQDNLTCIPCDSSCTTCNGASNFCLTCSNNQLASNGKCTSNCPSSTFSSAGACLQCHADCATCSGSGFNQCTSCPANRPVLVNGRCLPTCLSNQFLDRASGQCQSCDPSCSSCSDSGPSNCLACSGANQKLQDGTCVAAGCASNSGVIAGLGVCLSDLAATTVSGQTPLPTPSGINTVVVKKRGLEWWQILLMALGCAFIFLFVIWCFRRRHQKKRKAKYGEDSKAALYAPTRERSWRWRLAHWFGGSKPKTTAETTAYTPTRTFSPPSQPTGSYLAMDSPTAPTHAPNQKSSGWLVRWGEKLFGHTPSKRVQAAPRIVHLGPMHTSEVDVGQKLREVEEARAPTPSRPAHDVDMVRLIESYNRPGTPRAAPQFATIPRDVDEMSVSDGASQVSRMSAPSLYSQVTRAPRRVPEPRMPFKPDLRTKYDSGAPRRGEPF